MSKVLVVEDDKHISKALNIRLKKENFEVFTAQDAVQATMMFNNHHPDIVLMDIGMPGGNGFMVAERIQELNSSSLVPIIFISANKKSDYLQKAKDVGAVAYFEKPFNGKELIAKIKEYVS